MAEALEADQIALNLAGQELKRIGRIWEAHRQPVGEKHADGCVLALDWFGGAFAGEETPVIDQSARLRACAATSFALHSPAMARQAEPSRGAAWRSFGVVKAAARFRRRSRRRPRF
jgi:hypothetical protein